MQKNGRARVCITLGASSLHVEVHKFLRFQTGNIGSIYPGGHQYCGEWNNAKFKNGLSITTALPQVELQVVGHVTHMNTTPMNVDEARRLCY